MTTETDILTSLSKTARLYLGKTLHSIGSDRKPEPDSLETFKPEAFYGNLMVRFTGKKEFLSIVNRFGMYGHGQGGFPYSYLELHAKSLPRIFANDYDGASGYSSSIQADLNVYPLRWPELLPDWMLTGVWVAVVRDHCDYGPGDYLYGVAFHFSIADNCVQYVEEIQTEPWFFGMCFKPHVEECTDRTIFGRSLPSIDGNKYPWIQVAGLEETHPVFPDVAGPAEPGCMEPPELPDSLPDIPVKTKHVFRKFYRRLLRVCHNHSGVRLSSERHLRDSER